MIARPQLEGRIRAARTEAEGAAWRRQFIATFLGRDLPQLGLNVPAPAMRRFWTMLAHFHGQVWNAADPPRSARAPSAKSACQNEFMWSRGKQP